MFLFLLFDLLTFNYSYFNVPCDGVVLDLCPLRSRSVGSRQSDLVFDDLESPYEFTLKLSNDLRLTSDRTLTL